jgi:hypothetical protein
MSGAKPSSGRANHIRQKQNRINEQKSGSTEGEAKKSEDGYIPLVQSSVSPEKRGWNKFLETMSNWANVITFAGIISGFSIWASTLQFGLSDAKDNIAKHEKKLDEISVKVNNSQVVEAVTSSDIQYIKKNQDHLLGKIEKLSEERTDKKR